MASIRSVSTNSSPVKASHTIRGYLFIAAAALCWGISATLGRAAFTGKIAGAAVHPIDPLILSQSRATISFAILAAILLARRGTGVFRLPRRDWGLCLALGVFGLAASTYLYYVGIQRTNVATAIMLQYTAPIWVLIYMVARGRERATWPRIGAIALSLFGLTLAIGLIGPGRLKSDSTGLLAAAAAAFAFAYYNVAGAALLARYNRWRVLLPALLGASVFWQIVNPPWRILAAHYNAAQGLFLLLFAITSVLLPFSFYFGGLQYLQPTRAIVTSALEPVFSVLIAATALGEAVTPVQMAGIVVVLAATILVQRNSRRAPGDAPAAAESI